VVIPTFNRNRFIERSIRSVLDQSYRNIECLVMDGGSNDGSVETLQRLSSADPRLRFFSEPDEGEVYATNKGLDLARGDIIGVFASDDFYEKDAIASAVEFLLAHPEFIGVGGDARYVDESGKSLNRGVITYRGEMSKNTLRRILVSGTKAPSFVTGLSSAGKSGCENTENWIPLFQLCQISSSTPGCFQTASALDASRAFNSISVCIPAWAP
jgi:glycosyltransferase involved in cell wall biosynthesis